MVAAMLNVHKADCRGACSERLQMRPAPNPTRRRGSGDSSSSSSSSSSDGSSGEEEVEISVHKRLSSCDCIRWWMSGVTAFAPEL